jgi:hypothetical protein
MRRTSSPGDAVPNSADELTKNSGEPRVDDDAGFSVSPERVDSGPGWYIGGADKPRGRD